MKCFLWWGERLEIFEIWTLKEQHRPHITASAIVHHRSPFNTDSTHQRSLLLVQPFSMSSRYHNITSGAR